MTTLPTTEIFLSSEQVTLAHGAELNTETFVNFIDRLRHASIFSGTNQTTTADAIFNVQKRVILSGLNEWCANNIAIFSNEGSRWFSPAKFYNDPANERFRAGLDKNAMEEANCQFLVMNYEDDQWDILGKLDEHFLSGWEEGWENLNVHFTREAAVAFIQANSNDYPDGLRVHVTEQSECWEFNAIRRALIQGKLVFKELEGVAP